MTNHTNRVLYIGVTSDLKKRIFQHREGVIPGFTRKYNVKKLVYYEIYSDIIDAITREKQIKKWKRQKKIDLIKSVNRDWKDLYDDLCVSPFIDYYVVLRTPHNDGFCSGSKFLLSNKNREYKV